MKYYLTILLILTSSQSFAAKVSYKQIGIKYLTKIFAHVHQNPGKYSKSLTTITCGHPIKIYQKVQKGINPVSVFNTNWNRVKVGPHSGYLKTSFLSLKRPDCYQDRYSKYFEHFEMNISEIYYWGRLNDMFVTGKSKVY